MMYVRMIETSSLKILMKSFHENFSDLIKKQHGKTGPLKLSWISLFPKEKRTFAQPCR